MLHSQAAGTPHRAAASQVAAEPACARAQQAACCSPGGQDHAYSGHSYAHERAYGRCGATGGRVGVGSRQLPDTALIRDPSRACTHQVSWKPCRIGNGPPGCSRSQLQSVATCRVTSGWHSMLMRFRQEAKICQRPIPAFAQVRAKHARNRTIARRRPRPQLTSTQEARRHARRGPDSVRCRLCAPCRPGVRADGPLAHRAYDRMSTPGAVSRPSQQPQLDDAALPARVHHARRALEAGGRARQRRKRPRGAGRAACGAPDARIAARLAARACATRVGKRARRAQLREASSLWWHQVGAARRAECVIPCMLCLGSVVA